MCGCVHVYACSCVGVHVGVEDGRRRLSMSLDCFSSFVQSQALLLNLELISWLH